MYILFTEIIVLDGTYQMVDVEYNQVDSMLKFDLTRFPNFLSDHFQNYVEKNGIFVLFYDRSNFDYDESVNFLLESTLPSRSPLIKSWIKNATILVEGDQEVVESDRLDSVRKRLSAKENEELKGVFAIESDLDVFPESDVPSVISLHAKSNIDYDDVKQDDIYIKMHPIELNYPFLMIQDGNLFTMKETQSTYELPHPSDVILSEYDFLDVEMGKYEKMYETFNLFNAHYFGIEEVERSKIGGYFEDELPSNLSGQNWVQLLDLSSYSHPSDFFNDIGDCNVSIFIDRNNRADSLECKVLIGYT